MTGYGMVIVAMAMAWDFGKASEAQSTQQKLLEVL
jgi:hypothetical protein